MRNVVERGQVYGTGTNTAGVVIPTGNGQIVANSVWYTSPAAGTLVIYRAKQSCVANAAVSASATLVIKTDSAGKVGGAVLTTNDYVIVEGSNGSGWQFRTISNVASVSASTVSLTLGSTITCAANDTIYVVRAADLVSLTTANETVRDARYIFNGYKGMPVYALLSATGTCHLSVAYDVER